MVLNEQKGERQTAGMAERAREGPQHNISEGLKAKRPTLRDCEHSLPLGSFKVSAANLTNDV